MSPINDRFGNPIPTVTEWGVQFETRGSNIIQWFRDKARAATFAGEKGVAPESMHRREVAA